MTRVLVARFGGIGEVLVTGPAVRAVAARAGEVVFASTPSGGQAAALLPGVGEVIAFGATRTLEHGTFDQAIVFTSHGTRAGHLAAIVRMAGVPFVAVSHDDLGGGEHEVERALSLVESCGYPLPEEDDRRLAVDYWRSFPNALASSTEPDLPASYVVVHPGASDPATTWSTLGFGAVVDALRARGRHVVVTGAPGEAALVTAVRGPDGPDVTTTIDLDVAGLAELLAGASALVVGNTGIVHLAAAVGTPVVSLYASSAPADRWRPWAVPHVLLGDRGSLAEVTVNDVLDAVELLTAQTSGPRVRYVHLPHRRSLDEGA